MVLSNDTEKRAILYIISPTGTIMMDSGVPYASNIVASV